jgi:multimeric flavodoxin WrbA
LIGGLFSSILRFPLSRALYLFSASSKIVPKKINDIFQWGFRRAVTLYPSLKDSFATGKALILYWSGTGNTEKVAHSIQQGLKEEGFKTDIVKISEGLEIDYFDYDLVSFGTPVYDGLPPKPVINFIKKKFKEYRRMPSEVRVPAKRVPGKRVLIFVTFAGHHVGIDEALPTGKYVVQEFEHFGFEVVGEWYVVGEHHGWDEGSTRGRLGTIKDQPNKTNLERVKKETVKLVKSIKTEGLKDPGLITLSKNMTVFYPSTIKKLKIIQE